jgi:hypothetical protein
VLESVEPNCALTVTEVMMFVYFEMFEDLYGSVVAEWSCSKCICKKM